MTGSEVLTTVAMRALESRVIAGGTTGLALMERAGAAVAGHIRLRWPKAGRAVVLCGPGNNGGDGYVIARHLAQAGWQVRLLGTDTATPDAAEMRRRWAGGVEPLTKVALNTADAEVYVDAIFGIGLTRPPEGEIAAILARLYARTGDAQFYGPRTVAVDCPSGLDLDSGRWLPLPQGLGVPDSGTRLTVTFHSLKPGHLLADGPTACGEVVVAPIFDFQPAPSSGEGWVLRPPTEPGILTATAAPLAKTGGHKFTHGHALILAGGFGYGGAARLAARAALRVGAGLVTLGPPKSALIEHAGPPDALMRRGVDDAPTLAALLEDDRITAVALGPGCGIDRAGHLIDPILASRRPCVLDADALSALATRGFAGLHDGCVLTPHEGEFARLFPDLSPQTNKLAATREAAARSGAVVLLKGPDTVIAAPDGQARIHSAYDIPWLATAGAGDVLTGLIAGLLARSMPPLEAAATGAFLHGAAARRFGPGLIADDLPDLIPAVLRDLA